MTHELEERMHALRELYTPSEADQQRVKHSLSVTIAAGLVGTTSLAGGAPVSVWKALATKGLLLAGTGALIAGGLQLGRSGLQERPQTHSPAVPVSSTQSPGVKSGSRIEHPVSQVVNPPESQAEPSDAASPHPVSESSAVPLKSREPKKMRQSDSFAREAQLLEQASRALRQGKRAAADQALDTHATRFDQGKLAPEREGLRILSLCKSQPSKATSLREAKNFLRRWPQSPLAKHLRDTCALSSGPSEMKKR